MNLELILPTAAHRAQVEEFKQKFIDNPSEFASVGMHGSGSLGELTFDEWLQECNDYRAGKNLPQGYVPSTQFLAMRKTDNKLVGLFQIRHELTPHLERIGGHIGYSVAPDERCKGYATQMLRLGLQECKRLGIDRVRVTCVKDNVASARVILKNGGVFDGEAEHDNKVFQRYWIDY